MPGGGIGDAGDRRSEVGGIIIGQRHRPAGTVKQAHAQMLLQRGDGSADGGLGIAGLPRELAEAAGLDHTQKHPHLREKIHEDAYA